MIVGAGTVLTEEQLDVARDAGAKYALSPGIDHQVLAHAQKTGLPFAPGVMTPSDIQVALRANCKMVKFFPAVSAGGLDMLKNIAGPFLHTGIDFNPTGGMSLKNLREWLAFDPVMAVTGSGMPSAQILLPRTGLKSLKSQKMQFNWPKLFNALK